MAAGSTQTTREQQAAEHAAELILFADGIADAGHPELARRSRVVARDTLWLLDALANERSATTAFKDARDRMLQILATRVFCNGCRDAMKQAAQ